LFLSVQAARCRAPAWTVTGQAGEAQRVLVAISYWSRGAGDVTARWLAVLRPGPGLRRARRGERRDRRDLRLAGRHHLHALRRATEHADLVHRDADDHAGRRDEDDLLA